MQNIKRLIASKGWTVGVISRTYSYTEKRCTEYLYPAILHIRKKGREKKERNWKTVWQFLKKLSYEPVIPLPNIYPKELKTYVHIKTCI